MIIDLDTVPSSIEAAVNHLIDNIPEDEKDFVRNNDQINCHFTLGRFLRNEWSLWENDSPLKRDAVRLYQIAHPDDISGLILAWTWAKIRNETFDPVSHCQTYHTHWKNQGLTSLQAAGWLEEPDNPIKQTIKDISVKNHLLFFDGPLLSVGKNSNNEYWLIFWDDQTETTHSWNYFSFGDNDNLIKNIGDNQISLKLAFLSAKRCIQVVCDGNLHILATKEITPNNIKQLNLPKPNLNVLSKPISSLLTASKNCIRIRTSVEEANLIVLLLPAQDISIVIEPEPPHPDTTNGFYLTQPCVFTINSTNPLPKEILSFFNENIVPLTCFD